MSNGIKLNFKQSDNEPRAAMLRIVAAGGRACEGTLAAAFLQALAMFGCSAATLCRLLLSNVLHCNDCSSHCGLDHVRPPAQVVSRAPMARAWSASARGR